MPVMMCLHNSFDFSHVHYAHMLEFTVFTNTFDIYHVRYAHMIDCQGFGWWG
jgi:hypothetical protein